MKFGIYQFFMIAIWIILSFVVISIVYLIIKALLRYNKPVVIRKENIDNAENTKTLGEILKQHRVDCNMTQEFVAEALGVSRQAVSKWECGTSEPNTKNLVILAELFGVRAEDLLKEVK